MIEWKYEEKNGIKNYLNKREKNEYEWNRCKWMIRRKWWDNKWIKWMNSVGFKDTKIKV